MKIQVDKSLVGTFTAIAYDPTQVANSNVVFADPIVWEFTGAIVGSPAADGLSAIVSITGTGDFSISATSGSLPATPLTGTIIDSTAAPVPEPQPVQNFAVAIEVGTALQNGIVDITPAA